MWLFLCYLFCTTLAGSVASNDVMPSITTYKPRFFFDKRLWLALANLVAGVGVVVLHLFHCLPVGNVHWLILLFALFYIPLCSHSGSNDQPPLRMTNTLLHRFSGVWCIRRRRLRMMVPVSLWVCWAILFPGVENRIVPPLAVAVSVVLSPLIVFFPASQKIVSAIGYYAAYAQGAMALYYLLEGSWADSMQAGWRKQEVQTTVFSNPAGRIKMAALLLFFIMGLLFYYYKVRRDD